MEIFRRQLPRHGVNYYYSISGKELHDLDGDSGGIYIRVPTVGGGAGSGVCVCAHVISVDPLSCFYRWQTTNKNINKNREKHY